MIVKAIISESTDNKLNLDRPLCLLSAKMIARAIIIESTDNKLSNIDIATQHQLITNEMQPLLQQAEAGSKYCHRGYA